MPNCDKQTDRFSCYEIAPHAWKEKIEQGSDQLSVSILWGEHERHPGQPDFSQNSRLRIERLLSYCLDLERTVSFSIGFESVNAIPKWATQKIESTISAYLVDSNYGIFDRVWLPRITESAIAEAFLLFVESFREVLSLYSDAPNLIEKVTFSSGFYRCDNSFVDQNDLPSAFSSHYDSIAQLNNNYGTSFRSFDFLIHEDGIRSLFDRRAWLAASDLKAIRKKRLDQLKARFQKVFPLNALDMKQVASQDIVIDGTLVDEFEGKLVPFIFGQVVTDANLRAFHQCRELIRVLEGEGMSWRTDDSLESEMPSGGILTYICGRFLRREVFELLNSYLLDGGHLIFPFGLPGLDHKMQALSWPTQSKRVWMHSTSSTARCFSLGGGTVWIPASVAMDYGAAAKLCNLWKKEIQREEAQ